MSWLSRLILLLPLSHTALCDWVPAPDQNALAPAPPLSPADACPDLHAQVRSEGGIQYKISCGIQIGGSVLKGSQGTTLQSCVAECSITNDCEAVNWAYTGPSLGYCDLRAKAFYQEQPLSVPGNNIYIVAESFQQPQAPTPVPAPVPPPVILKTVTSTEWHVSTVVSTTTQHEISTTIATLTATKTEQQLSVLTSTTTEWKFSTVTNTKTEHELLHTTITEKGAVSTTTSTITSTKTDLSISPAQATKARIACDKRVGSQWQQSNNKLSLFDSTGGIRCCSGWTAKISPEELL